MLPNTVPDDTTQINGAFSSADAAVTGTGWTFSPCTVDAFTSTLGQALDTYRNHSDSFKDLQSRGMVRDSSWDKATNYCIDLVGDNSQAHYIACMDGGFFCGSMGSVRFQDACYQLDVTILTYVDEFDVEATGMHFESSSPLANPRDQPWPKAMQCENFAFARACGATFV